jgi:hypothetical protein
MDRIRASEPKNNLKKPVRHEEFIFPSTVPRRFSGSKRKISLEYSMTPRVS